MLVYWLPVLLSGVSYCDNREHVCIFAYDTKEKEHQTPGNLIYTWAVAPSYKSDSLVFRFLLHVFLLYLYCMCCVCFQSGLDIEVEQMGEEIDWGDIEVESSQKSSGNYINIFLYFVKVNSNHKSDSHEQNS
jgi:hypothetical protein